jgi:hypothetical protein
MAERNRLKNRSAPDVFTPPGEVFDTVAFLKHIGEFNSQTAGKHRVELNYAQKQQLAPVEKQIVQLTGYLVLAYAGPPETTNCGSSDFHDWHLEIFEKPLDHAPGPGDPTPIVCEISPRTQNAIYRDNIRIRDLTAFFRRPDMECDSTGHKARKIRVTGFLLWDDEHNQAADVGTTIRTVKPNKLHNPWRSAAWEIHPAFKIEALEGPNAKALDEKSTAKPSAASPSPEPSVATPVAPNESAPAPVPTVTPEPTPVATPPPQQFATITQPVKIKIPYGETILPRGARVPVTSRAGQSVIVTYMGGVYTVPISSTDLPP